MDTIPDLPGQTDAGDDVLPRSLYHDGDNIATMLPAALVERFELEISQPVRLFPQLTGGRVRYLLEASDDVDGSLPIDRRLKGSGPSGDQIEYRFPTTLCRLTGLLTDDGLARDQMRVTRWNDERRTLQFEMQPTLHPPMTDDVQTVGEIVAGPVQGQLTPIKDDDHPLGVRQFVFYPGQPLVEGLGIEEGDTFVVRLSVRGGDAVLVLDFEAGDDADPNTPLVQTVYAKESGTQDTTVTQLIATVPITAAVALRMPDTGVQWEAEPGRLIGRPLR